MAEKLMTKAEESAILDQIENLINSTEGGSYIRMAFAGCVRMARENIEYDFANSYPDLIEFKDKQISECRRDAEGMQKRIAELEEERDAMTDSVEGLQEILNKSEEEATNAIRMNNKYEEIVAEKDMEILRLKAEIYDLRKECGKK